MNLSELKDKQQGRICAVHLNAQDTKRLFYMGIYPGALVTRIQSAPIKDPILFSLKGVQLVLRKRECACIEVEVIT